MIIDCHGHFTTEPEAFHDFRRAQIAYAYGEGPRPPAYSGIDREELQAIIAENQLRLQQERGTEFTLLSPRASGMRHDVPDPAVAVDWARLSNDTILTITELYPRNFAAVGQLPQTVEGQWAPVIAELERCVEAGFVGFNVNPDPTGGNWSGPPISDPWWDPLWEAMQRLDVPAMIHVSGSCSPSVHTTGAHYIAGDTVAFMQLLQGNLFDRFPNLRVIIPHGGGAVPFHWGRYRGLAMMLDKPNLSEHLLNNVFFDTCVYHEAGVRLLFDVIPHQNILFGSELLGAVNAVDPETGHSFDDTRRYIESIGLSEQELHAVFMQNARRVYPLLDRTLAEQGR